jgi:hypothetical protein
MPPLPRRRSSSYGPIRSATAREPREPGCELELLTIDHHRPLGGVDSGGASLRPAVVDHADLRAVRQHHPIITVEELLEGKKPNMPATLLPYVQARRRGQESDQMSFDI